MHRKICMQLGEIYKHPSVLMTSSALWGTQALVQTSVGGVD